MPHPFRRLFDNAYVVLTAASLMWAGNTIIGKIAVGEVTPMGLTLMRWVIVCAILALFYRREAAASLPVLLPRWRWVVAMAVLGYTVFNALLYLAAHHTSAVNMTMLQASIPVFVLLGGVALLGARVGGLQVAGTLATLVGVIVVATGGDAGRLLSLSFNVGDVFVLVACALYAGYTLGLRKRPPVSGFGLFTWFAVIAMLASIPLVVWEAARGEFFWPTPKGWLMLLYIALCPSLLSQIFYIRGVDLIGPARAGLFINLIPVFGAFMAVLILGEPFDWAEVFAALLVFGGIALAEWGKSVPARTPAP
jgi:drug/metabolite transporter (DMT)-like permease